MLNFGPGDPKQEVDISEAPFAGVQDTRLAGRCLSNGAGSMTMNSNAASWNMDMVTTTGNLLIELLHHFHLERGARIHKLRVYDAMTESTGREVCAYLPARGSPAPVP